MFPLSAPCRRALPVSADRVAAMACTPAGKAGLLALGGRIPVRDRLSAGGSRIRTRGSAPKNEGITNPLGGRIWAGASLGPYRAVLRIAGAKGGFGLSIPTRVARTELASRPAFLVGSRK